MSAGGAKFLDAADEGGGEVGLVEVFLERGGRAGSRGRSPEERSWKAKWSKRFRDCSTLQLAD